MSFGAFSLFNFYQQPNVKTGEHPILNTPELKGYVLTGENGRSGTVADFNWFFPYATTNYIDNILDIGAAGYGIVNVLSDAYSFFGGQGLNFATLDTTFSGNFSPVGETNVIQSFFYGAIDPQVNDYGLAYASYSGLISGWEKDTQYFSSVFSGLISGKPKDIFGIDSSFSGKFISGGETHIISNKISGEIGGCKPDASQCFCSFSGKIIPSNSDLGSISYSIYSMTIGNNAIFIYNNQTGSGVFSQISYGITDMSLGGG